MDRSSNPNSHIQLIVPIQYLYGGTLSDTTVYKPFDGDVETTETLTPDTKTIGVSFSTTVEVPKFTLVYGHQASASGEYAVKNGVTALETDDYCEELYQRALGSYWRTGYATPPNSGIFNRTGTHFSSVLIEHDTDGVTSNNEFLLDIRTASAATLRLVMFSRDFKVPMFNKSWSCKRSFVNDESESYLKQKYPRFQLRNEYSELAEHSFEWTGLTDSEKRYFEMFIAAFGGNIAQPFAMCAIHGGTLAHGMTTRILLIDSSSVEIGWSRDKAMQRDGLSFSAIELIPT